MKTKSKVAPTVKNVPDVEEYKPEALKLGIEYMTKGDAQSILDDRKNADAVNRSILARAMSQPEVRAASIIQRFDQSLDINHLASEMREQSAMIREGDMSRPESMLIAQAHSLDALFGNLSRRAYGNLEAGYLQATETYLRLALRAQNQCRTTLETLSAIKNPPVVFAKQMNVSNGYQQINNGAASQPQKMANDVTRTLENETSQNELGVKTNDLLENTRASSFAVGAVQAPEAVGEIYRP